VEAHLVAPVARPVGGGQLWRVRVGEQAVLAGLGGAGGGGQVGERVEHPVGGGTCVRADRADQRGVPGDRVVAEQGRGLVARDALPRVRLVGHTVERRALP